MEEGAKGFPRTQTKNAETEERESIFWGRGFPENPGSQSGATTMLKDLFTQTLSRGAPKKE